MAYQRKTRDVWEVQQYTDCQYGWETVSACESFKEARDDCKAYRENQPEYPVRVRCVRERIARLLK